MQRARFLVALTVGLTLSSALAGCFEPAPLESSRIAPPPPREQEQEDEPVQPTSQPPPSNSSQPPPRSASNTTPPPAAAPPPLPGAFSFPNDAQGCQETLFLAPVDLGAAQALLPANYTAGDFLQFLEALVGVQALRDAAASAGVPLPDLGLGRGAVVWTVLSCAGSAEGALSFGELLVYIETPNVTGERDPVALDFYELGLTSTSTRLAGLLRPLAYPITAATTVAAVAPPEPLAPLPAQPAMTALSDASDAEGSFAHVEGLGAVGLPSSFTGRQWWAHPAGTVVTEFSVPDASAFVGVPLSCSFREGSAQAGAVGFTACATPVDALMFAIPAEDVAATYAWMPGVFAQGSA